MRADAICNLVLDTRSDFSFFHDDLTAILKSRPNLIAHSDGGCRNDGRAAFAWVIYAVSLKDGCWQKIALAMGFLLSEPKLQFYDKGYKRNATIWGCLFFHFFGPGGPARQPRAWKVATVCERDRFSTTVARSLATLAQPSSKSTAR